MKKMLLILCFLPILSVAQFKPYGHIEYVDCGLRIYEFGTFCDYDFGHISTKLGLEYKWKRLTIQADSEVFMDYKRGLSLSPSLAYYDFKIYFMISKQLKIGIKHRCIHPVLCDRMNASDRIYGGGNKIGIYFN